MVRIKVLPPALANKIAAGEVVQRPASIVKELVENSLDAGASRVTVAIEDGGKGLITVSDDGCGMSGEDLRLAVRRHATSKISSFEDLEAVATYGFRGEALPSVAAVSRMIIKSRSADEPDASVLTIEGGGDADLTREGREPGTTVTVRHLFFNVPARKKFLRSRATEFRHIHDALQRAALSSPSVGFHFVSEGKTVFSLPEQTLEERVFDLFGEYASSGLIPVHETGPVTIEGFIGKPSFSRQGRSQQILFVNRRPVVHRNLNHAVFSAYEHLMIKGTYPFFILFLGVDPAAVDVNVHPSKLEARFQDEGGVYRFVHSLVRKSISSSGLIPAAQLVPGAGAGETALRFTPRQHRWPGGSGFLIPSDPDKQIGTGSGEAAVQPAGFHPSADRSPTPEDIRSITLTGPVLQVHRKYIVIQVEDGLMMVDQHVAHERILYEKIADRMAGEGSAGQQLLFPRTLRLNHADRLLLDELNPYLSELGFSIRPFGGDTVIVESAPPEAEHGAEEDLVSEILSKYREYQARPLPDARDAVAKSFSCRAALKAGTPLTETEMRSLVTQLFHTRMPFVCPHGRPTVLRVSVDELDRRFGRT